MNDAGGDFERTGAVPEAAFGQGEGDNATHSIKRQRSVSDNANHEHPPEERSAKNPRIDSFEALDPEVRVKLRSMFDQGVIQEDELDNSVLIRLRELPAEDAVECLDQFCKCDISKVRNKSAYIIGVIRRLKKVKTNDHHEVEHHPYMAHHQHPPPPHQHPPLDMGGQRNHPHLDRNVQVRLNMLFSDGICKPSDIDAKCLDQLSTLSPRAALEALGQFANRDLSDVRSYSRFLMSIIRRVRKDYGNDGPGGMQMGGGVGGQGNVGYMDGGGQVGMGMPVGQMGPGVGIVNHHMGMSPNMGGGMMPGGGPPAGNAYDPLQPSTIGGTMVGGGHMMPMGMPGGMNGTQGGKKNYSMQQLQMGVRVDEFHRLSMHAPFVHYAIALKLQELWDMGIKLVAQLDDKVWQQLTDMRTVDALVCIEEVANDMDRIKNPNAYFMSMVRHFNTGNRSGPPQANRRIVRATRHGGGRMHQVGDLASLAPEIRQKIEDIVRSRSALVRRTDFDKGVCDGLMELPEHKAVGVLEELQAQPLDNVKNMSAFIMSICRRYKKSGR